MLDIEIKRWAAGKEGNLRALLSTLQFVLWPECKWEPVALTDIIRHGSNGCKWEPVALTDIIRGRLDVCVGGRGVDWHVPWGMAMLVEAWQQGVRASGSLWRSQSFSGRRLGMSGVPCGAVVCHGVRWCAMGCGGVPWGVVVCHGVRWCAMGCGGVPWGARWGWCWWCCSAGYACLLHPPSPSPPPPPPALTPPPPHPPTLTPPCSATAVVKVHSKAPLCVHHICPPTRPPSLPFPPVVRQQSTQKSPLYCKAALCLLPVCPPALSPAPVYPGPLSRPPSLPPFLPPCSAAAVKKSYRKAVLAAAVKKSYRKAALCVHPDKVQQKGATVQQKYIAEKVFDLLKSHSHAFAEDWPGGVEQLSPTSLSQPSPSPNSSPVSLPFSLYLAESARPCAALPASSLVAPISPAGQPLLPPQYAPSAKSANRPLHLHHLHSREALLCLH
ncbi:unnamed protein product, partial [Closterium sp. NIES-65]